MPRRVASSLVAGLCPTSVASAVDGPQSFHDLIFEDEALRIVGRHYGSRGELPDLR
jgi:hypothetical protein